MSIPEYHTHETPHQLYGAVVNDGTFFLLPEKDHNQLEQQSYFTSLIGSRYGPQRSAPQLSVTQREEKQASVPVRPRRAAPLPGSTSSSSLAHTASPQLEITQSPQLTSQPSVPAKPKRPAAGAISPTLGPQTLMRTASNGMIQSTSSSLTVSSPQPSQPSQSSQPPQPQPTIDTISPPAQKPIQHLPPVKIFPTLEAIFAAPQPSNLPLVPPRSRTIFAYPQIDAQLPIQPFTPLLQQTNIEELKEISFRYTERYFYEEGCLARQYWKRKYLQDVPANRFNRDEICLTPGNTNLFHMNGDVIQNVIIHDISRECLGFDISHTSGHRLDDDSPIGMILAYDFGAGNYSAFALGQAIRHENYFKPVHFTIHGGGIEGEEDEIHHNFLGGRQHCCYHSIDLVRKEQKDDIKQRLKTFFKKDNKNVLEKTSQSVLNQDPMGRVCIQFPTGKIGRFALLGQNEMIGESFRTCMLRSNGIYVSPQYLEPLYPQSTSFFTIENKYWRVIVLDTGYWSNFDSLNTHEGRLPTDLLRWLDVVVRPADDTRGLIFMSSHPHTTAFTDATKTRFVLKAIEEIIGADRTIIWLAGGERLTAIYEPSLASNPDFKHNTYLFCTGAGGLPMSCFNDKLLRQPLSPHDKGLVFYDGRVAYQRNYSTNGKQLTFKTGFPAFTRLDFDKDSVKISVKSLQLSYQRHLGLGHEFDVDNPIDIATYTFRVDKITGRIAKVSSTKLADRDILTNIVPHYKSLLDTPIHASTQDRLIIDDNALEPLKAGIRNLFLDSLEEWTSPTFPITVSSQFFNYCLHIGQILGDPLVKDAEREQQRADHYASLPKSESRLTSMRSSMRGSMKNLLSGMNKDNDIPQDEHEDDEEHAIGEPVSMFVSKKPTSDTKPIADAKPLADTQPVADTEPITAIADTTLAPVLVITGNPKEVNAELTTPE